MSNNSFKTTVRVDKSAKEVFEMILKVKEWWSGEPGIKGQTKSIGDEFTYQYGNIHYSKQKILDIIPEKKVVWLVTDSKLTFVTHQNEWTGTKIIFEITQQGNETQLIFTHEGLIPDFECYSDCSTAWREYIEDSLVHAITRLKYI